MEQLLIKQAEKELGGNLKNMHIQYDECVNPHALTDRWLDFVNDDKAQAKDKSYIWKIGALVYMDNNKLDFGGFTIATQRDKTSEPIIIGSFWFREGENDDIGRTMHRVIELLKSMHNIFENE